jgi:carbon starvation protein CstA
LGGAGALLATYVALLVVLTAAAAGLNLDVQRFAITFTGVFALAYASWIIGSYAYVAAVTPADLQKFSIGWSLKLTNEGGYIVALLVGLTIANFFPRLAELAQGSNPSRTLHQDRDRDPGRLCGGDSRRQADPCNLDLVAAWRPSSRLT